MKVAKRGVSAVGRYLITRGTARQALSVDRGTLRRDIEADIAAAGLEVEHFVKQRGDSKAVVLCRHPIWGRCVYKGYRAHSSRRMAHAHTGAARVMAHRSGALLPRVLEIGDHFSIEEYVPGRMLDKLSPKAWQCVDLPRFVDAVQQFGVDDAIGVPMADAVRVRIVEYYLRKSLNDVSVGPLQKQAVITSRLLLGHRRLRSAFHDLLEDSSTQLPTGWVTNDLNVRNVIVREGSGDLVVVDAEDLGHGHFMFDLTWFLAHVARLDVPLTCVESAYRHMFGPEVCGTRANVDFFKRLLAFFLMMNAVRNASATTRYLLSLVGQDL